MRLISSRTTFFSKRIFPVIWFGLPTIALLAVPMVDDLAPGVAMLWLMAVIGYVLMRYFVLDALDQVFDDGDALVLKNAGQEERVALSDIASVRSSAFNHTRVELLLRRPTAFGNKVAFIIPIAGIPGVKSDIVTGLIARVDRAAAR